MMHNAPLAMFGLHLHMAFATLWLIGAIFLIVWGIRHADKNSLKTWALWLLGIGIAGCLLTAGASMTSMKFHSMKSCGMQDKGMMHDMGDRGGMKCGMDCGMHCGMMKGNGMVRDGMHMMDSGGFTGGMPMMNDGGMRMMDGGGMMMNMDDAMAQ